MAVRFELDLRCTPGLSIVARLAYGAAPRAISAYLTGPTTLQSKTIRGFPNWSANWQPRASGCKRSWVGAYDPTQGLPLPTQLHLSPAACGSGLGPAIGLHLSQIPVCVAPN